METNAITVHLPLAMAEKVDQIANRVGRSRDWVIGQALSAWIDLEDEHSRLTYEALVEVDSQKLVDHATVLAWAKNLDSGKPLPKLR